MYPMPNSLCVETAEMYLEATFLHDDQKMNTLDLQHLTKILCDDHSVFILCPLSLGLRKDSMGTCQRKVDCVSGLL